MFYYLNQSENERLIQVYKEDKWIFYEKGYALPFENVNFSLLSKENILDMI